MAEGRARDGEGRAMYERREGMGGKDTTDGRGRGSGRNRPLPRSAGSSPPSESSGGACELPQRAHWATDISLEGRPRESSLTASRPAPSAQATPSASALPMQRRAECWERRRRGAGAGPGPAAAWVWEPALTTMARNNHSTTNKSPFFLKHLKAW